MQRLRNGLRRSILIGSVAGCAVAMASGYGLVSPAPASAASPPMAVTWMHGFDAPATPAQYDKVGVLKVGPSNARNVLVLEPGTSAGSAYFVPLAKWIVSKAPGWQVWSVERRENLLEDQSELNLFKTGKVNSTQLFDYYLGYINNPSVTPHFQSIPDATVAFAKQWGMNVAVQDLHEVIESARQLGGRVVLGGHSLGGSVVTAYATWDFNGHAGASDLAGLVYIDGGSTPSPVSAAQATQDAPGARRPRRLSLARLRWDLGALRRIFNATGSAAALLDPNAPSLGQTSGSCPPTSFPRFPSPMSASTATPSTWPPRQQAWWPPKAHLGKGLPTSGPVHGWNGTGALTPIKPLRHHVLGTGMQNSMAPSGTSRSD